MGDDEFRTSLQIEFAILHEMVREYLTYFPSNGMIESETPMQYFYGTGKKKGREQA